MSNSAITFLNHSSILVDSGGTKILCDPWYFGTAFADGWSLLFDKSHDINDIECDYIWVSHEHPDHFSIPTLSSLTSSKTFLYQETTDKKVKAYLEHKGHKVIELIDREPALIGDIVITSFVCDGYDSSILFEMPDGRLILNINDARVDIDNHLEEVILPVTQGRSIDLVLLQFGYANWAGNKGDARVATEQQDLVDAKNLYIIAKAQPTAVLGFASFVYFSHEENFYWNENVWFEHVNKLFSAQPPNFIFPSPNQTIELAGLRHQDFTTANESALEFWTKRHNSADIISRTASVEVPQLKEAYGDFHDKIHSENTALRHIDIGDFTLSLYLGDLKCTVTIGLFRKSFQVEEKKSGDIAATISSETLMFLFKQKFARGTITINSRVSFDNSFAHKFFIFFFVPYANNIGRHFNEVGSLRRFQLESIVRTSVLTSLLKENKEMETNLQADLALFD